MEGKALAFDSSGIAVNHFILRGPSCPHTLPVEATSSFRHDVASYFLWAFCSLLLYSYACDRQARELLFLEMFLIILILTKNGEAIVIKNSEAIRVLSHLVLPVGLASVTQDTKALS